MTRPKPWVSPNHDERPDQVIDTLVLHYTGMKTAGEAIGRLCDPAAKVSAHYVVEEDGTVLQLVSEERRAWHAGVSYWRGRRHLNDVSIGIEIVNPGHEWGYRPYPVPQMAAVTQLCLEILSRHRIAARDVVGHSDIAPDRKQDPGEKFDWRGLAESGVGLWPSGPDLGITGIPDDAVTLRRALARIGYDVAPEGPTAPDLSSVLRAFQRRWRQEVVNGQADRGTVDRIYAVSALAD